jgi:hypothetical protein
MCDLFGKKGTCQFRPFFKLEKNSPKGEAKIKISEMREVLIAKSEGKK